MDAGGRALVNQRVELLRDSEVLNSTATGSRGEWSFANVAAGDYVVRTIVNGQVAGIHVSVVSGQTTARALIVAPSAAAPSAVFLIPLLGLFGTVVVTSAVIVAAAFGVKKITEGS